MLILPQPYACFFAGFCQKGWFPRNRPLTAFLPKLELRRFLACIL